MADQTNLSLVTISLPLTACVVSFFVLGQTLTTYTSAYLAAPSEITTFIDAVEYSIHENEGYHRDVSKVQRLDDKLRMNKLLMEIQKGGDDLREDLNSLMMGEGNTTLKPVTRLLWASVRGRLEERMRRLDILRMRFLVLLMGSVATDQQPPKQPEKEKYFERPKSVVRNITQELQEKRKPPMRRLTTQAMGHNDHVGELPKVGWAGVVAELQRSPLMQKRHQSIENAMSPMSSPSSSQSSQMSPRTP